jgi:phospholipid transport system substrate-binding protein
MRTGLKTRVVHGMNTMRKITVMVAALFAFATATAQANAPGQVIEDAVDLLTEGLNTRRDELAADDAALREFIDSILLPRFDREFAAGAVLGKHWRTASAEQKNRFVTAFYETLLQRYAEGVVEFDMSRVEVLPYRGDDTKRTTVVKTEVRLDDGKKVPVNYTLVNRDSQWRMFDVQIEGVSYVINFRKELDSEIRSSSLEDVIVRLEREAGIVDGE